MALPIPPGARPCIVRASLPPKTYAGCPLSLSPADSSSGTSQRCAPAAITVRSPRGRNFLLVTASLADEAREGTSSARPRSLTTRVPSRFSRNDRHASRVSASPAPPRPPRAVSARWPPRAWASARAPRRTTRPPRAPRARRPRTAAGRSRPASWRSPRRAPRSPPPPRRPRRRPRRPAPRRSPRRRRKRRAPKPPPRRVGRRDGGE